MKRLVLAVLFSTLFFVGKSSAYEIEKFPFKVKPEVLKVLKRDANVQALYSKGTVKYLLVDKELTSEGLSTATAKGILFAMNRTASRSFDLVLGASVEGAELLVDQPLEQIEKLEAVWEKEYAHPSEFKKLNSEVKKLEFHDDKGFVTQYQVKGFFDYLVAIEMAAYSEKLILEDKKPELAKMKKFIKRLEGDERSRIILANNKSGLPTFIYVESTGTLRARHPFHDIVWNETTKDFHYEFKDNLADVFDFPEIKLVLKNNEVGNFLKKEGDVRISLEGNKKSFVVNMRSLKSGEQKTVRMEKKVLTVENARTP